jgi:Gpi18-like mannosyltransferase
MRRSQTFSWLIAARQSPYIALAFVFLVRLALWPLKSSDYEIYLHPWLQYIVQHGYHRALGQGFTNYEPAYTYLLVLISYLIGFLPELLLIKVICFPFELLAAWAGMQIVECIQPRTYPALPRWTIFAGFLCLPTVILNNSAWGQCDVIYSAFLLLSLKDALLDRPYRTALWFGVALSFKFQALFFSPFILLLLLVRRIRIRHLLVVPLMPVLFGLPAVLEGRPSLEIAKIFFNQADTYHQLVMNAANLWQYVDNRFYPTGVGIAYLITVTAILAYLLRSLMQKQITRSWLLLSAVVSLALMPFFLPKMHDRYFFPAELACAALAFSTFTYWVPALLMQLASVFVYSNFLFDVGRRPRLLLLTTQLAVISNTCAVAFLFIRYFRGYKGQMPSEDIRALAVLTPAAKL